MTRTREAQQDARPGVSDDADPGGAEAPWGVEENAPSIAELRIDHPRLVQMVEAEQGALTSQSQLSRHDPPMVCLVHPQSAAYYVHYCPRPVNAPTGGV